MKKVYLCELETSHFSWKFLCESEKEAENAVKSLWQEFCESDQGEGADPKAYDQDDWDIIEIEFGALYRDYDIVWHESKIL